MNEITNDAAIIAALGRQMTRAVQKQSVAAGNLANLDTPGYRTKEVKFDEALTSELRAAQAQPTHERHFGAGETADPGRLTDVGGLQVRVDGNNVSLDRELLSLSRASGEFNAAQTVLAAKFRLVRYAINEGR